MSERIVWLLEVVTGEQWIPRWDSQGQVYMWIRVRNEQSPAKAFPSQESK